MTKKSLLITSYRHANKIRRKHLPTKVCEYDNGLYNWSGGEINWVGRRIYGVPDDVASLFIKKISTDNGPKAKIYAVKLLK